jgi:hypothetical protein
MRKKKQKNFESINTQFFIASEYYFGTNAPTIQFELNQNKMKKLFIAAFFYLTTSALLLSSCTKSTGTNMNTPASVYTPIELAGDPAFVGLNDALIHFDPHYLQLVYGDQRTTTEINDSSMALITKLQTDPTNINLQKQLADFYKFNSITELKYYSDQILINASAIKNKYFTNNKSFSNKEVNDYFKARSLYAKNKMDSISHNTNRIKTSSMYDDYVLFPQPPAFIFFGEMDEEDVNAGGDVGACKDNCCTDFVNCNQKAGRNFLYNSVMIGATLATSTGVVGAGIASLVPFVGTAAGAGVGVSVGSYLGVVVSRQLYNSDLYSCVLDYRACQQRKSGN